MQLPRGRFLYIRKDLPIGSLIEGANVSGHTGYLAFFVGDEKSILVIEKGRPILAEYGSLVGKEAFDRLYSMRDTVVDVEFFALTDVQVSLAREFNKTYILKTGPEPREPVRGEKVQAPDRTTRTWGENAGGERRVQRPSIPRMQARAPDSIGIGTKVKDDLSILDTMDLEKMAKSMKENSRMIVEKLELEHLLKENV